MIDHEARKRGIGGSDAAILVGSPFSTPRKLAMQKLGMIDRDEENDAMWFGTEFEAGVAKRYCMKTGRKVRRQPILWHPEHDWMLGNVDRQIVNDPRGPGVLEVKTVNAHSSFVNGDHLPEYYRAQMQHYLAVTGYSWGAFAVLVGGQKFFTFEVEREPAYIESLIKLEKAFWDMIQSGELPPVTEGDIETLKEVYPRGDDEASYTLDDPGMAMVLSDLHEVKARIKELEGQRDLMIAQVQDAMGLANEMVVPGFGKATWKNTKDVTREILDKDKLRVEFPEVASQVLRFETVPGARRFNIWKKKD